jgi:hypothetical protein
VHEHSLAQCVPFVPEGEEKVKQGAEQRRFFRTIHVQADALQMRMKVVRIAAYPMGKEPGEAASVGDVIEPSASITVGPENRFLGPACRS